MTNEPLKKERWLVSYRVYSTNPDSILVTSDHGSALSRMEAQDNAHELFIRLKEKHPHFEIFVVGPDGKEHPYPQNVIEELDLDKVPPHRDGA
ncbi:hypothetical protein COU88_03060 [Candidatus Roizmanbacteria bacterium CG10_big_fil_rev_8_21_14_0_10_39_6]|uniref:Uncharacterized protein n=1 Tax=Candidatus Roizmanbacteria bacterium CG10_big_fil_rev_8_21_14_0_10_39_6 TaxID=1974853 RepID=A0A2M8KSA4_9BACT|nr:MAG: hypothetical protein COU88_03060 [Candidatus Roizmanbacteria bacterium CG10_big_fil_rev_8_21_14_0_10_39_6]